MVAGAVDVAECPLALERLLVALDLPVDLWAARWDQEVAHTAVGEELGERPVAGVCPRVVAHQAFHLDPARGEVGESALDKAGDGCRLLVAVELAVGVAGVVVDDRVHPFEANPHPFLPAAAEAIACDSMAGPGEADKALRVDVEQIARARPLVEAWLLTRLPGQPRGPGAFQCPPHGRVRMTGLARDQPRPPA